MRLKDISLSWFRGAGQKINLQTKCKSIVIYGPNGAGKSTFIDAVEYLVSGGRIKHLLNEYSGRRLEKAIINTQSPHGHSAKITIQTECNSEAIATILPSGAAVFSGLAALSTWQHRHMILRQDEVSAFVQAAKAEKYSSILPLIGLGPLELVATNVRSLKRRVAGNADVQRDRGALAELERTWAEARISAAEAGAHIKVLFQRFLPETEMPDTLDSTIAILRPAINARIQSATGETKQHLVLANIHNLHLDRLLSKAISATVITSRLAEPLLEERLAVLIAAERFTTKVDSDGDVICPSCGRSVPADVFRTHIQTEKARLEFASNAFVARDRALSALLDGLQIVQGSLRSDELRGWTGVKARHAIGHDVNQLLLLDIAELRLRLDKLDLGKITEFLSPVTEQIKHETAVIPPEAKDLLAAAKMIEVVAAHPRIKQMRMHLKKVDELISFLEELEIQIRDEIRIRTESVILGLSTHIQRMWDRLHPALHIREIKLYQPADVAKAIDIELSFYGQAQPSPRLSLSEGDRHSLGLCIFLTLSKQGGGDQPLFLDDVVNSLDREHRSKVADLVVEEFSDRQVLIFTHEYEWFIELKHRLPSGNWEFKTLLPFDEPGTGIRWSGAPDGFANARILLDIDPKSAANSARGLMDLHMGLVAERLGLPVPFLRGPRNDLRNALELLERFISRSPSQLLRLTSPDKHQPWDGPTIAARNLKSLLIPWGNAGSHGRYLTRSEAEQLIDTCELFLDNLNCEKCKTHITHATVSDKHYRCSCDQLRWKL